MCVSHTLTQMHMGSHIPSLSYPSLCPTDSTSYSPILIHTHVALTSSPSHVGEHTPTLASAPMDVLRP